MAKKSTNTVWHKATITRSDREILHDHKSVILWFTGLSGSGKSTLAHAVEENLHKVGVSTYVLDGDNVRDGLCSDLGFSDSDRVENIRRVGEIAKLMIEAGIVNLTAFIRLLYPVVMMHGNGCRMVIFWKYIANVRSKPVNNEM